MATELEQSLFEEELQTVRELPDAKRWQLERDMTVPLGLFAIMHPISNPKELYKTRIRWTDYFRPFSVKFINMMNGTDNDPSAWPRCSGFRPSSLDICLPWTAEGHALHPEWKNSVKHQYPKVDAPMQFALLQIQYSLDTCYEGRGIR